MVAEAKARLSLDSQPFIAELDNASTKSNSFADDAMDRVAGAITGAFAVENIISFVTEIANAAVELGNLADQLDISVESLQSLRLKADETGASTDAVDSSIRKLKASLIEAKSGNEDLTRAFDALGVSGNELDELSLDQIIQQIGNQLALTEGDANAMSAVFDLIGKTSGVELQDLFQSLAETDIPALNAAYKEQNRILTEESVTAFQSAEAQVKALKSEFNTMATVEMASLITAYNENKTAVDNYLIAVKAVADFMMNPFKTVVDAAKTQMKDYGVDIDAIVSGALTDLKDKLGEIDFGDTGEMDSTSIDQAADSLADVTTETDAQKEDLAEQERIRIKLLNDAPALKAAEEKLETVLYNQKTNAEKLEISRGKLETLEQALAVEMGKGEGHLLEQTELNVEIETTRGVIKTLEEKIAAETAKTSTNMDHQKAAAAEIERIATKREKLARDIEAAEWAQLTPAQQLEALEQRRENILASIAHLEETGQTDLESYIDLKTDLFNTEQDIKNVTEDIADEQERAADEQERAKDEAAKSVGEVLKLRDELSALTDQEITALLAKLKLLAAGLAELPKIDIKWLNDLKALEFKGLTDGQARQMASALKTLAAGINELPAIKDDLLDFLEDLKNIEFVSLTDGQARQMVRALTALIQGLDGLPAIPKDKFDAVAKLMTLDFEKLDKKIGEQFKLGMIEVVAGLKELNKLDNNTIASALNLIKALEGLKGASGGDYTLEIKLPKGMESGIELGIPSDFNKHLESAAASLETLAKLKGVIWA